MTYLHQILSDLKSNPSELLESDQIEFKEYVSEAALHNSKDLAEEIVAISNSGGGSVIIGVRDSSNVVGNDWPSQLVGFEQIDLLNASARIRGKIKPHLEIDLQEIEFEGKYYLRILVPPRRETLITTSSGKVYIRDGRSSRPMEPAEIENAVKSLSSYDWTSDLVHGETWELLEQVDVEDAKSDFQLRREISEGFTNEAFLEAIGATRNGSVTRAGLLFFGSSDAVRHALGLIEFRFSWKTVSGNLKKNEIWSSNLWDVIKKYKKYFTDCNSSMTLNFRGNEYEAPLLDPIAFHEALMNALVHRDYAKDGIVSVDYNSTEIRVSSPGRFYGGITEENIHRHQPRHRNKALAKLMMDFALVDRAGMGVPRMSLRSLRYGPRSRCSRKRQILCKSRCKLSTFVQEYSSLPSTLLRS